MWIGRAPLTACLSPTNEEVSLMSPKVPASFNVQYPVRTPLAGKPWKAHQLPVELSRTRPGAGRSMVVCAHVCVPASAVQLPPEMSFGRPP